LRSSVCRDSLAVGVENTYHNGVLSCGMLLFDLTGILKLL